LITAIGFFYLSKMGNRKVAVVDITEVYQSFDLTKELDKKYTAITAEKQTVLDSLEKVIISLRLNFSKEKNNLFLAQIDHAVNIQKKIIADNEQYQKELDQQIWTQLNEYMTLFSKAEKVDIMLGSKGDGTVLFLHEKVDMTKNAIEFINKQYAGIN